MSERASSTQPYAEGDCIFISKTVDSPGARSPVHSRYGGPVSGGGGTREGDGG